MGAGRLGAQLARGGVGDDPAPASTITGREVVGLVDVVGVSTTVLPVESGSRHPQVRRASVEPGGRLVEEQDVGAADHPMRVDPRRCRPTGPRPVPASASVDQLQHLIHRQAAGRAGRRG